MDALIIVFFIFGSAAIIIWKLMSFSKDRYGLNSPLKIHRTYQTTCWKYFTSPEQLFTIPFFLFTILILIFPFTENFHSWQESAVLKYGIVISVFLISLYNFLYRISLQLNYWKFTKEVVITSVPSDHSLQISMDNKEIILRNGDLEKIQKVSNKGRTAFSYFTYFLKNGQHFILTDRTPGRWVIEEYFRKIPVEHLQKHFPFIK